MQLETDIFGMVTYEETDVILFNEGLFGFETAKRFILLDIEETPYKSLQSLDVEDLAFTVTSPFIFFENYDFDVPDYVVKQLEIESLETVDIYSIIVLRNPIPESTLNLKAPIIMNLTNKLAKQVIVDEEYPMQYKFLTARED